MTLAGAVLIAALTTTLLTGIEQNAAVSAELKSKATTQLSGNVSFVADDQLQTALDEAGVPPQSADAVVQENATARIDGLRSSLSVLALIALIATFFSRRIPAVQPGSATAPSSAEDP